MKRMITKKMRDSFKVSFDCKLNKWHSQGVKSFGWSSVHVHFKATKKQRILILRRVVK